MAFQSVFDSRKTAMAIVLNHTEREAHIWEKILFDGRELIPFLCIWIVKRVCQLKLQQYWEVVLCVHPGTTVQVQTLDTSRQSCGFQLDSTRFPFFFPPPGNRFMIIYPIYTKS